MIKNPKLVNLAVSNNELKFSTFVVVKIIIFVFKCVVYIMEIGLPETTRWH